MMSQPRVLIVEDEPTIAELIALNLRHNGFASVWAEDGEAAQRELDEKLPDLILLDWMLPGQDGIMLTRKWRAVERTSSVPIVMLTARSEEPDKVAGLDAGVDDYITKPFSTQEMMARIRAVLRRPPARPVIERIVIGALIMEQSLLRVTYKERPLKIGPTEFKLLHFFMANVELVHSRTLLLDKVWGNDAVVDLRTVDVHVMRLREALGEAAIMVETVRGAGYRLTSLPRGMFSP
jgi:two-component system, OmpR family, phosphate regulon response regulator PhoB